MPAGMNVSGPKILIVEPETAVQRQLRTILSSLGHKSADIESCSDSKLALSILRKRRFDLSFVSISKAFDGFGLVREVRKASTSKSLPVVMYSMNATRDDVLAAIDAGASTVLAYPFSVSDVEGAIRLVTTK